MTVFALDGAAESLRGELTRWFLELKPGVFVGRVNARIRDLLWERICAAEMSGAVMAYDAPNEQGFEMRLSGSPQRSVVDLEGISLILYRTDEAPQDALLHDDPSETGEAPDN